MDHLRSHLRYERQVSYRLGLLRILPLATAAAVCASVLAFVALQSDGSRLGSGHTGSSESGVSLPPASAEAGEYRFHQTDASAVPVGWNPCEPIPYWIGSQNLPGGGTDLISWVLAEVTGISGQRFDFKGYTDAVPTDDDPFPVDGAWIGWTTATSTDSWLGHELDGPDPAIGLASRTYGPGGWTRRGWAMLLADYNPRADADAGGVLRHEIGHMLGLDHTVSPDEVMTPGGPSERWGPGDRRGLWLLGPFGGCE